MHNLSSGFFNQLPVVPWARSARPPRSRSLRTACTSISNISDTIKGPRRLSELSTWGVGGDARLFAEARSGKEAQELLAWALARNVDCLVIGRGSNLLFDDRGFDGLVVLNLIDFVGPISPDGLVCIGAGTGLPAAAARTAAAGWSGLEFFGGIPGTVGGAVFMNSGADGCDAASALRSVEVASAQGGQEVHGVSADLQGIPGIRAAGGGWGYRRSPFQALPPGAFAITAATFQLRRDPLALRRLEEGLAKRRAAQPLAGRSAGCVFRNPAAGSPAGLLIDRAGLKGVACGGAVVSEQHANFLMCREGATAADVSGLIDVVRRRVLEATGTELQEEIVRIPFRRARGRSMTRE